MFQLHFDNQVFSDPEDFRADFGSLPDFAESAFTFCRSWLSGEHSFVQHTSGSTGVPKKIELSREQMQASAMATRDFFGNSSDTTLLCCLNPVYIAGKMMLVRAMVWNCPIWLVEPTSAPLEQVNFSPDFVAMVPLQAEQSIQHADSLTKLQTIGNLIIGGAQLSEKLKGELIEHGIQAWQTYGMTETVSHIALARISRESLIYETLPGVEIGQDSRGALWIKSPMSGSGKVQTNDLVELKSERSFSWLGRTDFVINSGAIKLHPEVLEQRVEPLIQKFFPGARFFFFGENDEKLGQKLVLILESGPDIEKSKKLTAAFANILGRFEVPKEVYFSQEFVMTLNGKINRHQTFDNL
jgi:O-succinylbenzoic acid--CoA ligase